MTVTSNSTNFKSLYPSINDQHLNDLTSALCDFKVKLPKILEPKIRTIVKEFLEFKKSSFSDFEPSVLNCLDFHYSNEKLKIIEANTNASGYMLTNLLLGDNFEESSLLYEKTLYESFLKIFKTKNPEPLYIIDDSPEDEKMYPEFLMYKDFFIRQGLTEVKILKTKDLKLQKSFVYNRDTDFYFDKHPQIKKAIDEGNLFFSTTPKSYNQLASKTNDLVDKNLSPFPNLEKAFLNSKSFNTDFWATRKNYFFKPKEMFGGKGVYSGKSISRKKFETLGDNYLVQESHPPGKVMFQDEEWKFDIRAFFSEGDVQKIAARVYQGQLTNFSKTGGGFASIDWV